MRREGKAPDHTEDSIRVQFAQVATEREKRSFCSRSYGFQRARKVSGRTSRERILQFRETNVFLCMWDRRQSTTVLFTCGQV